MPIRGFEDCFLKLGRRSGALWGGKVGECGAFIKRNRSL